MPSSELGSSPSMDIRRAVSRALRPASTRTRVPFATSRTELPVEPLPSTESFMSQITGKKVSQTTIFSIYHLSSDIGFDLRVQRGPASRRNGKWKMINQKCKMDRFAKQRDR